MGAFKIAEAKARFSELVEKAMMGEEVIIARGSRAVVKLVAIEAPPGRRKPGSAKGTVRIAADFDAIPRGFEKYT